MNNSTDDSDVFKTPSPAKRRKSQRNLFTDRCNRTKSSGKQDEFRNEMENLPSTPKFYSPLQHKIRDRSRTDPIPSKFRCEMPMSARKIEPTAVQPSEREFLPIVQSTFYGAKSKAIIKSSTKTSPLLTPVALNNESHQDGKDFVMENRRALQPLPSQTSSSLSSMNKFQPKHSTGR